MQQNSQFSSRFELDKICTILHRSRPEQKNKAARARPAKMRPTISEIIDKSGEPGAEGHEAMLHHEQVKKSRSRGREIMPQHGRLLTRAYQVMIRQVEAQV